MPRENRKRGKKHKPPKTGTALDATHEAHEAHDYQGPIHFPLDVGHDEASSSGAPFGILDPDVKAYFKTVDDQLRDWQDEGINVEVNVDTDPNEERRMFFTAALKEMNGKELQLATDPDCSPILERMVYSMDDFARRVFTDSLAGSWLPLMQDRFASHVCQTLFTVTADTIARETRGIFPATPNARDKGELLTMTQLVLNTCEVILPEIDSLVQNSFASHVLRAILVLLAPKQLGHSKGPTKHVPHTRSKKSASWKTRHGPMKSVIIDELSTTSLETQSGAEIPTPKEFLKTAIKFLSRLHDLTGSNEVRALAVDKVASPLLQMFLVLEAAMGGADKPDSIMDRVLAGLITELGSEKESTPSPYVSGLFLDATSSHLAESILSNCSSPVLERIWDSYFAEDLPKLVLHPVANFVVAQGVRRLDAKRLHEGIPRLQTIWNKALKFSRIGVLTAMTDRAGQLGVHEADVVESICSAFELNTTEDRSLFVSCVLRLIPLPQYKEASAREKQSERSGDHNTPKEVRRYHLPNQLQDPLEPKLQGSLLLQSVLRLHEPYNNILLESLHSLSPSELLAVACNGFASRVLDVVFESSTVPLRSRKRLIISFLEQFHALVDDRIGSRVADRCWAVADPYLKEKIGRSLIPHEQFLAGSHFGRFFTRNLNLPLLQRDPIQWKTIQTTKSPLVASANRSSLSYSGSSQTPAKALSLNGKNMQKRKQGDTSNEDEIDVLFNGVGVHKRARGIDVPSGNWTNADLDEVVLKAIKSAP